jgi:hypothetical protein
MRSSVNEVRVPHREHPRESVYDGRLMSTRRFVLFASLALAVLSPLDSAAEEPPHKERPKPAPTSPPEKAAIEGRVIQIIPNAKLTIVVLDKGHRRGVKLGDTGTIDGVDAPFKVTEVYEFRAKAMLEVERGKVTGSPRFKIVR